jgi:hypothetical protein
MSLAIDTVEVLDNLLFQHTAATEIHAVAAAGSASEIVKTTPISIPDEAIAARVLFNNNYDNLGAAEVCVRVKYTKTTSRSSTGVPTKAEAQLCEWTKIDTVVLITGGGLGFLATDVADLSAATDVMFYIDCAIIESAVAHAGTEIIVQMRTEANPVEWCDLTSFIGVTGTGAAHLHPSHTDEAGQKILRVSNPTAVLGFSGKKIFLYESAALATCEIVYVTACGADA